MRSYSDSISLSKNDRGIYSLDPTMGCSSGMALGKKGCYDDCYAARIAKIYGYDFSKTVLRQFKSVRHVKEIRKQVLRIPLPFVRMGTMGDPSENWEHTLNVCRVIQTNEQYSLFKVEPKEIVIITKHWQNLSNDQLQQLKELNICVNTSVSVLDNEALLENSLIQHERIKPYCRAILRVVSFDFNTENEEAIELAEKQRQIFNQYQCLDTVFRASKNNKYITDRIINIKEAKFLGKRAYISKYNRKTYFGKCSTCKEMCGVKMKSA